MGLAQRTEKTGLEPDLYYVEENGKRRFESPDLYICLFKSRQYNMSAKVSRRSDGALLAYRTRSCLTDLEREQDSVHEDADDEIQVKVRNGKGRRKRKKRAQ
jgi:hypothetical protein